MPEVLRHPEAEADLDEIWLYIAQDDPGAADRFIDRIEERCSLLAENPLMGRSRPELASNLRSFPIGNYVIVYIPIKGDIDGAFLLRARLIYIHDRSQRPRKVRLH